MERFPVEIAVGKAGGLEITPVTYMPVQIMTKENVEKFHPPRW
jgi:hypothetical protein